MKKIMRLSVAAATMAIVLGGASGAMADWTPQAYEAPNATPAENWGFGTVPVLEKTDAAQEAISIASMARAPRHFSDPLGIDHTQGTLEQGASFVAPASAFYPGDPAYPGDSASSAPASNTSSSVPASAYYPGDSASSAPASSSSSSETAPASSDNGDAKQF